MGTFFGERRIDMLYKLDRRKDGLDILDPMGQKDILVGIPSYKNQSTIGHVVQMVARGLKNFFSGQRSVIMNSDGCSADDTRKNFQEVEMTSSIDRISSIYTGISGKGSAFRNIFEVAKKLNVKAVLVVDSDLRSITPNWVKLLLEPVIRDEMDYVTPLYIRHKYDGTITNNIVYPLTRALYGYDIRQPIGGDFGFSGKLLDAYLGDDVWETYVAKYGIDIWMTTTAIVKGYRMGQAALGAKIHDAKDPAIFLAPMFRQVVGTCFTFAGKNVNKWKKVNTVNPVPLSGEPRKMEPDPVMANFDALIKKFTDGWNKFTPQWQKYLSEENFQLLNFVNDGVKGRAFDIQDEKWAHIIYDFMIAYNKYPGEEEILLDSLTPLYFLKVADFMNKADKLTSQKAEERIIAQADSFINEKKYLMKNWSRELVG